LISFSFEKLLSQAWASAEFFPGGGGKVDILLIFFRLLAMQRKWTYTKSKCPMLRQQLQTLSSLWENFALSKCLFYWAWIFQRLN